MLTLFLHAIAFSQTTQINGQHQTATLAARR
jgi:hypothetical protein